MFYLESHYCLPKNKIKKHRCIHFIFWSLLIISFAFLDFLFLKTSILPTKYLILALGAEVLALGVFFALIFPKKIKTWIKIIADIFMIIFITIAGFASYYILNTMNFLGSLFSANYAIENYSVYVLSDSEYKSLSDLEGTTCASYVETLSNYDEAFEELKSQLNFNTNVKETYTEAAEVLLNNEADFILLSASSYSILEEYLPDFATQTTSIYSFELRFEIENSATDVDVTKEPFNLYISGIDTTGSISTVSRSDVNMIVTINPKTHKILLTSIPRDYYVQLHGTTGTRDKLTHSGIYGISMTTKTVEDFMGITLNYYARVNFQSVVDLVDAIDGIELTSTAYFHATDSNVGYDCTFYANTPTLVDGGCALAFARERHAYPEGDVHRVWNQQQVLTAIINKIASPSIISNYTDILAAMTGNFDTNLPTSKIYDLINLQLDQMPNWQIETYNLDGEASYDYTYSLGETNQQGAAGTVVRWVMEPDWSTVETAREKIEAVMNE